MQREKRLDFEGRREVTDDVVDAAESLLNSGHSIGQVAHKLSMSTYAIGLIADRLRAVPEVTGQNKTVAKSWTGDVARLKRMRRQGLSHRAMAKALGRSVSSIAAKIEKLIARGELQSDTKPWSTTEKARLAELRASGKTIQEIAVAMNRSTDSIRNAIARFLVDVNGS